MINLDERYHSYLEGIKNFRLDGIEEKVKSYGWDCDGSNIVGYYVTTETYKFCFDLNERYYKKVPLAELEHLTKK